MSEAASGKIPQLEDMSLAERGVLALKLLQEQVVDQRKMLHYWRDVTHQPAQIDTGYVSQHLVSLVTGIKGNGMRGKGFDLSDGAEVKGANFLDSLDNSGSTAPRWNFQANNPAAMEAFLQHPAIYLVSIDLNEEARVRVRIWRVYPERHSVLKDRYVEWMEKFGRPKLIHPDRPGVNFQLFPPRNRTSDNFARHGNDQDRARGFRRRPTNLPCGRKFIRHGDAPKDGSIILDTMLIVRL